MKKTAFSALILSCISLCGCSFGASIDTLMAPPKLGVDQQQIYSALTDAVGSSISLKYPKSGKYLSAFIVEDIDGDGGSEAVVFYEKTSLAVEENTLRINVLDQENGSWRSVCDTPADGAEIEKVMISQLGSNDRINLIIGTSLVNRSEKNVSIYNYSGGAIEKSFSSACSFIDVTDLDRDGMNEFLLLAGASSDHSAMVDSYKLDDEGIYHRYSCDLSGSFTEFDSLQYGQIDEKYTALYIDAHSGTGLIQTDIVYLDSGGMNKVFKTAEESLATVRPSGCKSYDIDKDGALEIPVQKIAPGYEQSPESEQMKITHWLAVDSEGKSRAEYRSYYSINYGYVFIFPERWHGNVTVKTDAINDEIVFCALDDENRAGRELLRIYCAEDSASREDRISSGYMVMHTKGETAYLACIPQTDENSDEDKLSLSAGETAVNFRLVN